MAGKIQNPDVDDGAEDRFAARNHDGLRVCASWVSLRVVGCRFKDREPVRRVVVESKFDTT